MNTPKTIFPSIAMFLGTDQFGHYKTKSGKPINSLASPSVRKNDFRLLKQFCENFVTTDTLVVCGENTYKEICKLPYLRPTTMFLISNKEKIRFFFGGEVIKSYDNEGRNSLSSIVVDMLLSMDEVENAVVLGGRSVYREMMPFSNYVGWSMFDIEPSDEIDDSEVYSETDMEGFADRDGPTTIVSLIDTHVLFERDIRIMQ